MKELYYEGVDNAEDGKCCSRIRFAEYPKLKCEGCVPEPGLSKEQLDNNPFLARDCLEIDIVNDIYWRICHRNKDEITRLKLALVRGTVIAKKPDIDPSVMSK